MRVRQTERFYCETRFDADRTANLTQYLTPCATVQRHTSSRLIAVINTGLHVEVTCFELGHSGETTRCGFDASSTQRRWPIGARRLHLTQSQDAARTDPPRDP